MNEKQAMLRITLAQKMISEILQSTEPITFGRNVMSDFEIRTALQNAYSELNVAALRGETRRFDTHFADTKYLIKNMERG